MSNGQKKSLVHIFETNDTPENAILAALIFFVKRLCFLIMIFETEEQWNKSSYSFLLFHICQVNCMIGFLAYYHSSPTSGSSAPPVMKYVMTSLLPQLPLRAKKEEMPFRQQELHLRPHLSLQKRLQRPEKSSMEISEPSEDNPLLNEGVVCQKCLRKSIFTLNFGYLDLIYFALFERHS